MVLPSEALLEFGEVRVVVAVAMQEEDGRPVVLGPSVAAEDVHAVCDLHVVAAVDGVRVCVCDHVNPGS
jgi:hypothetical protein